VFAPLDWEAPWYEPWRDPGRPVLDRAAGGQPLHEALNGQGAPVHFVAASALPPGQAYERFIFERGACPCRGNLHDFFNGLCWLGLPHTKRRLNELQAAQIERAGVGAVRGAVRDAITIFDENGAVLAAPPAVWDALLAREWRRLFVELRPLWDQARLTIVGHALLEKLAQPRKDLTAHVLALPAPASAMPELDRWLAGQLTGERLQGKPFTPLPVLGVPGWWPGNQNFSFYDDSFVFRAPGAKKLKTTAPPDASRP
jgi:hypothetical protein